MSRLIRGMLAAAILWGSWVIVALSLSGCVIVVPPPKAERLANPCATMKCVTRPDTRRIA